MATPARVPAGEGVSLLFTPTSKATDGQKVPAPGDFRSFSGLGRTPASAGRAYGGRDGAGAHPTPSSRRRSLTPASSRQMDTPPPPPMDSLLDSPGGLGTGPLPWPSQDGRELRTGQGAWCQHGQAACLPCVCYMLCDLMARGCKNGLQLCRGHFINLACCSLQLAALPCLPPVLMLAPLA